MFLQINLFGSVALMLSVHLTGWRCVFFVKVVDSHLGISGCGARGCAQSQSEDPAHGKT